MKLTRVELEGLGICHYSGEILEECIASGTCVCHLHPDEVERFRSEVTEDVEVINDDRGAL